MGHGTGTRPDVLGLHDARSAFPTHPAANSAGLRSFTGRETGLDLRLPQAEHFRIVESPMPTLAPGQVLVRTVFWSVDPAMRGWVNAVGNYPEPVEVGAVMRSLASGIVEASLHPDFRAGDLVTGLFGWREHAAVDALAIDYTVDPHGPPRSASLGVLGLNGLTAYFGLLDVGAPRSGETVVGSTAAGSVGSAVGQIAKLHGCHAVGIAGGADVYFDNDAGPISDAVTTRLNVRARVVVCGTASVASLDPIPMGPHVEWYLLVKRARMQGFVIFDCADRYAEARARLAARISEGRLRYLEDLLHGIEHAPDAIAGLYRGENRGKRLSRVSEDPTAPVA